MRTRFGLHTGTAVVGNVGGPDRMDYTAMGAAVNLASRLEGLNKFFGTDILVSETVRNAVEGRFIFRRLGRVIPKGARNATEAFELVGTNPAWSEAPAELKATEPQVDFARRWNAAYGLYLARKWDEAAQAFAELEALRGEDRAAGFYAKRAEAFRRASPPLDWDGVEAFETK